MTRGTSKPKVVRSNRSGRTIEIIGDFGDRGRRRGNRVATSEGLSVGLRIGARRGPRAAFSLADPGVNWTRDGSREAGVLGGLRHA